MGKSLPAELLNCTFSIVFLGIQVVSAILFVLVLNKMLFFSYCEEYDSFDRPWGKGGPN